MATDVTPCQLAAWRCLLGSWDVVVILAVVAVAIVGSLAIDGVASPRFWRFVTLEIIPIALIALPMTLIIITGEIDLSVASIARPDLRRAWDSCGSSVSPRCRCSSRCACCWAPCSARSTARSSPSSGCRRSR